MTWLKGRIIENFTNLHFNKMNILNPPSRYLTKALVQSVTRSIRYQQFAANFDYKFKILDRYLDKISKGITFYIAENDTANNHKSYF